MSKKTLFCVITLAFFLAGCSTTLRQVVVTVPSPTVITAPVGSSTTDASISSEILERIRERNKSVENEQEWIKRSYSGLMIRNIANVAEREYPDYIKYLDRDSSVYIIIHPAFFPFFHDFRRLVKKTKEGPFSTRNVAEKFMSLKPKNEKFYVLQAQERRTRDFIEYKSTEEKLVILVIPKNYQKYKGYVYRKRTDEYMRYLNEITNFSKSVLFVESRSPNRGYISDDNSIRLMEFLLGINAENIYIGGAYIGRCLEDFYKRLRKDFGGEGIYIVPELADISPRELSNSMARGILNPDGSLNTEGLTYLLKEDVYKVQEMKPAIKNLP
jgi:hypothetical protein